jgi:hypothetical protein
MGSTKKTYTLLLTIIIIASSLLTIQSANAQTIPKPSVPDFSLKFINTSYSVIDPYTGISQQIDNSTIEVKIQNQPITYSNNNVTYHLYYNIRTRPHFEGGWTERYPVIDRANSPYNADNKSWSSSKYLTDEFHSPLLSELNSDYTVVSYSLNGDNAFYQFSGLPSNAQIDFEVEAIVGHDSRAWYVQHPLYPEYGGFYEPAIAYDTDSGWSNTQTITIPEGTISISTSPAPKQTPTITQHPTINTGAEPPQTTPFPTETVLIVALLAMVVVLASLLLYQRNRKRTETSDKAVA